MIKAICDRKNEIIHKLIGILFLFYVIFVSNFDLIIGLVIGTNLFFIKKRVNKLEKNILKIKNKIVEELSKKNGKEEDFTGVYNDL